MPAPTTTAAAAAAILPSANFSPSQARHQLAQAKDWAYVDRWLAARFLPGRPVPAFERNPDTLQVLLALAACNEAADEERDLLAQLETTALAELTRDERRRWTDTDVELLEGLREKLSPAGQESLESIAGLAVALGSEDVRPEKLAASIISLSTLSANLAQLTARVDALHATLERSVSNLQSTVDHVRHSAAPVLNPPSGTNGPKTATSQSHTQANKHLTAKLAEYRDRLESVADSTPCPDPTIQDLVAEENELVALMARVREVEGKVASYMGLPCDRELALLEVERARQEVEELVRKRDRLFEGLVEGEGG